MRRSKRLIGNDEVNEVPTLKESQGVAQRLGVAITSHVDDEHI